MHVYPFTNQKTGGTEWLTAKGARMHRDAAHFVQQSRRPSITRNPGGSFRTTTQGATSK
jgi:hypothetical protein